MPAAAVILAPIAYLNVVAVKKLVVKFLAEILHLRVSASSGHPLVIISRDLNLGYRIRHFTLKKSKCFSQAFA